MTHAPTLYTPWFPHTIKPARPGVYRTRLYWLYDCGSYSYWSGDCWGDAQSTPERADKNRRQSWDGWDGWQANEWFGLAQEPKGGRPMIAPPAIPRDDILRMACVAGAFANVFGRGRCDGVLFTPQELERFTSLATAAAVAAERDACATIARRTCAVGKAGFDDGYNQAAIDIEKAIRARGAA